MKDKRLVIIEWLDHSEGINWKGVADIRSDAVTCFSVGWLWEETKDTYVVVPHYGIDEHGKEDQATGDMTILKVAVVSVKYVAQPATKSRKATRKVAKARR